MSAEAGTTQKSEVISAYRRSEKDCGSPEVQIALLTKRLETLQTHFGAHHKDRHSRVGMMRLISRRKSLLEYLKREDVSRYRAILGSLGLRK